MSGIVGGGAGGSNKNTINVSPIINSLRIQSSAYGIPIPIVFGTNRLSGNIIYYDDFKPVPIISVQKTGGKGGGGGSSNVTVNWDYYAAVIMALGEGPIAAIYNFWENKAKFAFPSGKFSYSAGGAYPTQATWPYLTGAHPDKAFPYQGLAYVANEAMYAGRDTASLPNYSFEIGGIGVTQYGDTWPSVVVSELLTNTNYGAGMTHVGSLSAYANYTVAMGLFMSPIIDAQQTAAEWLLLILKLTNTGPVWSENVLKLIPYGDEVVTGNGVTYTPNLTPVYDLDTDDFITEGSNSLPVSTARSSVNDAYNQVTINCLDRANDYTTIPIQAQDLGSIRLYGLRPQDPIAFNGFTNASIAQISAQLILQRRCYVRNTYTFKLPPRFPLLEPMDLVTLTEPNLGLDRALVRITLIEENSNSTLTITAEETNIGVAGPARYAVQEMLGYLLNYNGAPGNCVKPTFFEPLVQYAKETGLEVWTAVSGDRITNYWGGANVWVSTDGNSYLRAGTVIGGARYGTLLNSIPADVGAVARVKLVGAGGTINTATGADALNLMSLCWLDGEYVCFTTATLVGTNEYLLTLSLRGVYGSPAKSHAAGAEFARIDDSIVKSGPLELGWIGKPIYFKFTSFNVFMGGEQTLDEVVAYVYTIKGDMVKLPPPDVLNLRYLQQPFAVRLLWDDVGVPDLYGYELRADGATWETATYLGFTSSDMFVWDLTGAGTRRAWIKALDRLGNYSANATYIDGITELPSQSVPIAKLNGPDLFLTWEASEGSFAIDSYIVRRGGTTWENAETIERVYSTAFRKRVDWGGVMRWWVAAVDVAGNQAPATHVDVSISSPASVRVTSSVIDNNVLLQWSDGSGTLPIDNYEIRKGATWAGAELIGFIYGRFTVVFEQSSGDYIYWVAGRDSAGNEGVPSNVTAKVAQPPDYVLVNDLDFDLTAPYASSNALWEQGKLLLPVDTTEIYSAHFSNRSWASPQDQVNAGYPIYIEPVPVTSYIEFIHDFGVAISATSIVTTLSATVISGAPVITPKISVKTLIGDSWTDYDNQSAVFVNNIRYVKVRYTITGSGGDDVLQVTNLHFNASVKKKRDSGVATASTSDSTGTIVTFNEAFYDIIKITGSAKGTTAKFIVIDFTDTPSPTQFKAYAFDAAGARVTTDFYWDAEGIGA